jgi:hypothetical protein
MVQLRSGKIQVSDDIVDVNRFFYEKGWTDGLPIIPPTEERIQSFLEGTLRNPEEVVGLVPPKWGEATVEKVAVNAVMAGCLPEYMPIVIAAVRAMVEAKFNLYGVQATTHPCGPLLIINGPIRKQLVINCGYGVFGPGALANATIGRAIRLALLNIGGAAPGEVDKATHGQPGKFTYAIGENEEKSPWEPLSAERGFSSEQSTITVIAAEAPHNVHDNCSSSATGILTTVAGTLACQGNNNVIFQIGEPIVVLGPEHAQTIMKDGFTKKDVKEFLFQMAKIPRGAFSAEHQQIKFANLSEDALIPITRKPEDIIIVVAGGAGKHSMVIPTFGNSVAITKAIEN